MKRVASLPSPGNARPLILSGATNAGYTLAEFMVGMGAAMVVSLALILGSVALQRAFAGSDQYATAQNNQLRVMDYLTRDLRRAQTVSVLDANGVPVAADGTLGTQVSVTVPDYYNAYDSKGNPSTRTNVNSQPLDVVTTSGSPVYGANSVTITYFVNSTTNTLNRQVKLTANGVDQIASTVIADSVQNFQLGFVSYGSIVQATITFAPILQRNSMATARAGTTLNAAVTLRNVPYVQL